MSRFLKEAEFKMVEDVGKKVMARCTFSILHFGSVISNFYFKIFHNSLLIPYV